MTKNLQWRTCIHEAGHVVIASYLGTPVTEVCIRADVKFGYGGHIVVKKQDRDFARVKDIERRIMVNIAGLAAETSILGPNHRSDFGGDFRESIVLILDLYYDSVKYVDKDAKQQTSFIRQELSKREVAVARCFSDPRVGKITMAIATILYRKRSCMAAQEIRKLQRKVYFDHLPTSRSVRTQLIGNWEVDPPWMQ